MLARLEALLPAGSNLLQIISVGAGAILVLSLWLLVMLVLQSRRAAEQKVLRERLGMDPSSNMSVRTLRLWHDGGQAETHVAHEQKLGPWQRFALMVKATGWAVNPGLLLLYLTGGALLMAFTLYAATGRVVPSFAALLLVAAVFSWFTTHSISKRQATFERQLVDGLELCSRALRAGHPLIGSFELISEEIPAPVGTLFAEICQQQAMGTPLEEAIQNVTRASKQDDLRLFSASLSINIRTGGNLADVIEGIARVIRDRMHLSRRFRVLQSQTQFSKRVLLAMPVIMFFVLNFLNPEYMQRLYDERIGNILLGVASLGMLLGWWVMNRMSEIKY